jgi:hypothetical protein
MLFLSMADIAAAVKGPAIGPIPGIRDAAMGRIVLKMPPSFID